MGILDAAIREHLELKRRRGATESELKELEDEAFGPPRRPEKSEALEAAEAAPMVHEPAELLEPEMPLEEEPSAVEAEELGAQPILEDEEAPPEPAAAEEAFEGDYEAEAVGPNGHPEQAEPDLTELDLDLQEKELEAEEPEEPAEAGEPGVEALETREHPMEELLEEAPEEAPAEEAEVESSEPAEEAAEPEPPAGVAEGEEEEDEDVLEDTPEFLQDRPEDDELWFEQGEPKDFDF